MATSIRGDAPSMEIEMAHSKVLRCVPCPPERPFSPSMESRPQHAGAARSSLPPLPAGAQEEEEEEGEGRPAAVLSLDQIHVSRSSNDYTDSPTAAHGATPAPARRGSSERPEETPDVLPPPTPTGEGTEEEEEEEEEEEARHSLQDAVSVQPKAASLDPDPPLLLLKPPPAGGHARRCQACGRCVCARPRPLPSCWACGGRCVCSPRAAVEHATCVCCVKGLFYHCSSDDEDTCADKPFSCTETHCCLRWAAVALLALLFPCLLCHLPARGCLAACQACYRRTATPGCRCRRPRLAHCAAGNTPT